MRRKEGPGGHAQQTEALVIGSVSHTPAQHVLLQKLSVPRGPAAVDSQCAPFAVSHPSIHTNPEITTRVQLSMAGS